MTSRLSHVINNFCKIVFSRKDSKALKESFAFFFRDLVPLWPISFEAERRFSLGVSEPVVIYFTAHADRVIELLNKKAPA